MTYAEREQALADLYAQIKQAKIRTSSLATIARIDAWHVGQYLMGQYPHPRATTIPPELRDAIEYYGLKVPEELVRHE